MGKSETVNLFFPLMKEAGEFKSETTQFKISDMKIDLAFSLEIAPETEDFHLFLVLENRENEKVMHCEINGLVHSRVMGRKIVLNEASAILRPREALKIDLNSHRFYIRHCFSKRELKSEHIIQARAEFDFDFTVKRIEDFKEAEEKAEKATPESSSIASSVHALDRP